MALTPLNLIEDAKLQAYPHMRDELVSPGALLRQLTSLDREVVGLFATHAPERISAQGTDVTIVFANNAAGYALSAAKFYTDFKYISIDGEILPIEIVPEGKAPSKHPAARVQGLTFLPIDPLDRGWDASLGDRNYFKGGGDEVQYRFIVEPSRVTSMSQTLASPDEAESYLRDSLALNILLSSGEAVPQDRIQHAAQLAAQARRSLLHEMTKRTGVSARFGE